MLRARNAFLMPTLVTHWALPREGREHGLSATSRAKVEAVPDRGLAAVKPAHAAGVRIVFGSDLLGGRHRDQNEEFRLRALVQPVIDVIRSATTTAAALLDRSGTLA